MNANKAQSLVAVIADILTTDTAISDWLLNELDGASFPDWLRTDPRKAAEILSECIRIYGETVSRLANFFCHDYSGKETVPEERLCFWCTDPFWPGQNPVIIERTVCDTNGSHIEQTWFHTGCVEMAIAELLSSPV